VVSDRRISITAVATKGRRRIAALQVHQWLDSWDGLEFDERARRRKPQPKFYLASMPASELRALADIYRREAELKRSPESGGVQRHHEEERSKKIAKYVHNGFPWSELSDAKRRSGEFDDLRKPGWLPTAIVINILREGESRQRRKLAAKDAIDVEDRGGGAAEILLPASFGSEWSPDGIPPIEVIDGQHRLWAFKAQDEDDFDLPVVAFYGLDVSWQAYLFYSINITPKKINRSLAYDLYPLLRGEDWLERFEGTPVYRETRAQELTEALWASPASPWHERINMLGSKGQRGVSQAAWIRALMATFVRTFEGRGVRGIGGLFGPRSGEDELVLEWSAAQQAAFLIMLWNELFEAIEEDDPSWARSLIRSAESEEEDEDEDGLGAAIEGRHTLLNSDQGVRGLLHVANDLFYVQAEELELAEWRPSDLAGISDDAIEAELESLAEQGFASLLTDLGTALCEYDWRSSKAPGLGPRQRELKARFRGSGGYKELRMELTRFLIESGPPELAEPMDEVAEVLGFDE
jgi:DGQHR domain-containing protein